MRFPVDHFYKRLHRVLFAGLGRVETEVEVAVDTQRIDTRFRPSPRSGPPLAERGAHGRIAESPVIIESYSWPPSHDEVRDCVRKLLASHHLEVLAARRACAAARTRTQATGISRRIRPRPPPGVGQSPQRAPPWPEVPVLWITSPGRPRGVVEAFAFRPLEGEGWPAGVYTGPQPAIPMRLVLVNELPVGRETLALRLMGRGAVRRRAVQELAALPAEAWEQQHIAPLVVELQQTLSKVQTSRSLTEEEKELLVDGQKMIQAIETKGRKAGIQQGLQAGLEQGRKAGLEQGRKAGLEQGRKAGLEQGRKAGLQQGLEQGLQPLVRMLARKLGRPLTEREHATVVRRLGTLGAERLGDVALDLEAPALAAWLANPRAR